MSAPQRHEGPKTGELLAPEHIRELFSDINAQLADFQDTLQRRWSAHQSSLTSMKRNP